MAKIPGRRKWYELFSRGARDWLRHDEKVREAVRAAPAADRRRRRRHQRRRTTTVRVPVRMLEHYHFRLRRPRGAAGRRPGRGQARRRARRARSASAAPARRARAASDDGEVQLLLEFKIDDIVDWLWEEMQLPNLKAKASNT